MNCKYKINRIYKAFEGALKIGVLKRKPHGRYSDAFVYFISGSVKYIFDSISFTANAGNVIFLPKNSFYEMQIIENAEYICIDFDFEDTKSIKNGEVYQGFPSSIRNDFEKFIYNWYRREPWCITEAFSAIYRIYSSILRAQYKNYNKSGKKTADAMKYILEHYTEPDLTINEVASEIGVSETHLRRLIKNKTSMSPIKYISYLRIEKAKNMLRDTNCTVTEISSMCGFNDQYYFSREFKSNVGVAPSEYKKI